MLFAGIGNVQAGKVKKKKVIWINIIFHLFCLGSNVFKYFNTLIFLKDVQRLIFFVIHFSTF